MLSGHGNCPNQSCLNKRPVTVRMDPELTGPRPGAYGKGHSHGCSLLGALWEPLSLRETPNSSAAQKSLTP